MTHDLLEGLAVAGAFLAAEVLASVAAFELLGAWLGAGEVDVGGAVFACQ